MKGLNRIFVVMVFIFMAAPLKASPPDVTTIIKKTEKAITAWRSGTRKLVVTVKDGSQVTRELVARNAYKEFPDGKRGLLVILEPKTLRGSAHLFWKRADKTTAEWVYSPGIQRVRSLSGLTAYDSFLGTDFTYADLGIKDPVGTHRLLGEEVHTGTNAYKIETIPQERWYYSRIISWIAVNTFLPIQRDYYDANGRHWKTKLFEHVVTIDNIPKPLRVRMLDLQRNHSTEVSISDFCYDVESLSKETLAPERLSQAVFSPVCTVNIHREQ